MMNRKFVHDFRVGDVLVRKDGKEGRFVVTGIKGWIHKPYRDSETGLWDASISVAKSMGVIPLLTRASEYKRVLAREHVHAITEGEWWKIFTKGEK